MQMSMMEKFFYDRPIFYDDCDMDVEEQFAKGDISLLLMLLHAPIDDWQGFYLFASNNMIKDGVMTTLLLLYHC